MKNIETIFLKLMREAIAPHGAEEAEALAKKVAEIIPSDAESGAVTCTKLAVKSFLLRNTEEASRCLNS